MASISVIPIDKSKETALEVLTSEKSYLHALKLTIRAFLTRLKTINNLPKRKSALSNDEIDSIFLNISEVYHIQKAFYEEIKMMRLKGTEYFVHNIHSAMLRLAPSLSAYNEYARKQMEANATLHRLRQKNSLLQDMLTLIETAEGTTLEALLIQPVQRVPRYILLIKEMLRHVKNEDTKAHLQDALVAMETAASNMNVTVKVHETQAELVRLEELFQMRVCLVKPGRILVKEGLLRKSGGADSKSMFTSTLERRSYFLLFNDMLICASDSQLGPCKMRFAVPLHLLRVIEEGFQSTPTFRILTPSRDLILTAESETEAQDWIEKMNASITEFKQNNEMEKRSTEAELEFTLKRNPAKLGDIAIMSQYMEHVVNNEDSINAATASMVSGAFQSIASKRPSSSAPASPDNSGQNSPRDPPSALSVPSNYAVQTWATPATPKERTLRTVNSMSMSNTTGLTDAYTSAGPDNGTMQGYLSKRGDGIKTWKRRFFVVDTKFKLLRYFKDEESSKTATEALGFIDLDGCVVLPDIDQRWGPHAFEVYPQTSDRCYMLIADDADSAESWISFLKQFTNKDRFVEGYLLKKGAQLTGWKKRYFVCLQSLKELLYFKTQADSAGPTMFSKAVGSIHLQGCTIRECSSEAKASYNKGSYVFEIQSAASGNEKVKEWMSSSVQNKPSKTYVMASSDSQSMQRWILLLTVAVGSTPQDNEQRLPHHVIADLDE